MTACDVQGCVVRGLHEPDCDGEPCKGCRRREAAIGVLCDHHWNRLVWAVAAHDELIAHLKEAGKPYAQAAPLSADVTAHGDPAEGTVIPAQWLEADSLHHDLRSWALAYLDEHPATWPNRDPWFGHIAWWMSDHLREIAAMPWAGEFAASYLGAVETLHHRWPTVADVEAAHKVTIPCPRCGLMSLVYTPPRLPRQPFVVECSDPDCARRFSEAEWDRFVALAMREVGA